MWKLDCRGGASSAASDASPSASAGGVPPCGDGASVSALPKLHVRSSEPRSSVEECEPSCVERGEGEWRVEVRVGRGSAPEWRVLSGEPAPDSGCVRASYLRAAAAAESEHRPTKAFPAEAVSEALARRHARHASFGSGRQERIGKRQVGGV